MDTTGLREKNFEAAIEQWLITEGGYIKGTQETYDKSRAIDMPVLIKFIENTQPKKWKRYVTSDRTVRPILSSTVVNEIIEPGYIQRLSPERRFDQTLYFTVQR